MKNLLIIYPHWPPSNLAGVHRPRLIANFASDFGWHPIVLTVDEQFYEEMPDQDLRRLVGEDVEVIKVKAFPVLRLGFRVGDIGLRGFWFLYRKALEIIRSRQIDFIWIPIPAFYTALLGRMVFEKTGVPYGIDYIDPWVSKLAPYHGTFSKPWLANQVARWLEPIAVKKAALISGVSTPYYQAVLDRNFSKKQVRHIGMPYGFDPQDHTVILPDLPMPWPTEERTVKPIVYAGAFLPQSHLFLQTLFQAVQALREKKVWDPAFKFYFLGTGSYEGQSIEEYAKNYDLQDIVVESRSRFPFLHVLNFLSRAHGVLVIGSTEKHYTASKIFQSLLSQRPVFSMFHAESSAVTILEHAHAAQYTVKYQEGFPNMLLPETLTKLENFVQQKAVWQPDLTVLDEYSAKVSAKLLFQEIETVLAAKG